MDGLVFFLRVSLSSLNISLSSSFDWSGSYKEARTGHEGHKGPGDWNRVRLDLHVCPNERGQMRSRGQEGGLDPNGGVAGLSYCFGTVLFI